MRFFYDSSDGVCKGFSYGGCGGNPNNFESADECSENCGPSQDLCSLPPVVGPCDGAYEQYYYDRNTDSCQTFTYGGCQGNNNRFTEKTSCEVRCRRKSPDEYTTQPPGRILFVDK